MQYYPSIIFACIFTNAVQKTQGERGEGTLEFKGKY